MSQYCSSVVSLPLRWCCGYRCWWRQLFSLEVYIVSGHFHGRIAVRRQTNQVMQLDQMNLLICVVFLSSIFRLVISLYTHVYFGCFLSFVFLKLAKCWRSVDWSMVLGMLLGQPGCSQPLAWPNKLAGIYCSTLLLVGINISLCLRWLGMEGDFPVPGTAFLNYRGVATTVFGSFGSTWLYILCKMCLFITGELDNGFYGSYRVYQSALRLFPLNPHW